MGCQQAKQSKEKNDIDCPAKFDEPIQVYHYQNKGKDTTDYLNLQVTEQQSIQIKKNNRGKKFALNSMAESTKERMVRTSIEKLKKYRSLETQYQQQNRRKKQSQNVQIQLHIQQIHPQIN